VTRTPEQMRWLLGLGLALLMVVGVVGCPGDDDDDDSGVGDDDDTSGDAYSVDLDVDSDLDGSVDSTEDEDAVEEEVPGAVLFVNIDDDNSDQGLDCDDGEICVEENDLSLAVVGPGDAGAYPEGGALVLTLTGDAGYVRVFYDGAVVLGVAGDDTVTEYEMDAPDGEIEIEIDALDFHFNVTLTASVYTADGDEAVAEDTVAISTPPFMMFNHLDVARHLYVMNGSNILMRGGIAEAIGQENMTETSVYQYGWDVWIQDEIEFGYQQTPAGPMDLVLDSIRTTGSQWLDAYPEDVILAPDFGHVTERGSGWADSVDSFGNLECSPPVTVDGTEHPFGRIYYGGRESGPGARQVVEGLRDFLAFQQVQSPVELDSVWLAVGHVDEFMLFLPAPGTEKGFKLGWTDWQLARDILEGLDPNMELPRFADDHGFATVGEILESSLPDYNDELDVEYMQPVLEIVKAEFGLTDDDVVLIPGVWERTNWGGLAMIPGMTNLAVYNEHLLIADPFLRTYDEDVDGNGALNQGEDLDGDNLLDTDEDANGNGVLDEGEDINLNGVLDTEEDLNSNWQLDEGEDLNGNGLLNTYRDPFILYMLENMPEGLEMHFLDDWETYHLMWGEVHCGTNILRTPRSDVYWWEVE
jgi:protein-arginine deiminase